MGREAQCFCQVGSARANAKVLLEATEVIIRRVILIRSITDLRVDGTKLAFRVGKERVSFDLGEASAQKWLAAMQKPPATLAHKLGIKPETGVRVLGEIDCAELREAIAVGRTVRDGDFDVIIACVDSVRSLQSAIRTSLSLVRAGEPLWIIYPKGSSEGIGETLIREAVRAAGLRDTKVASVSSRLTALRFSIAR